MGEVFELDTWQSIFVRHKRNRQTAIRRGLPKIADRAVTIIRKGIPPGGGGLPGMPNKFPGYAATGALKKSIKAGPVVSKGFGDYQVSVRLQGNQKVMMYGTVHEYGMIIRAKGNGYMTFQVPPNSGNWVRVKQVYIRPKRYFRSGWKEFEREVMGLIDKNVITLMYRGFRGAER